MFFHRQHERKLPTSSLAGLAGFCQKVEKQFFHGKNRTGKK